MSKHSKWSKVKNEKGVADAKRAGVFTKLGRAITIAAKQGGGDPSMNFRLRLAIEKAKGASMPKDTIERAVARGTGTEDGATIEEATYEGFGPGGAAILVHALTDNKNRTLMNIRTAFSKHGGNLGGQNAIAWMFEQRGVIRIPVQEGEETLLQLIDAGAEDVREEDDGVTLLVAPERLEEVKGRLETLGYTQDFAEVSLLPKEKVSIADPTTRTQLETLLDILEEDEDVDDVVTNADM